MDFSRISDAELSDLHASGYSKELFQELGFDVHEVENSVVREDATREYFARQLDNSMCMQPWMLDELLALPVLAPARQLIGECARLDQLPEPHLESILDALEPCEWAHKQVQSRIFVNRFDRTIESNNRLELIECLLELKATWALRELLSNYTKEELQYLLQRVAVSEKRVLNRGNRHLLREEIKSMLENE